MLTAKVDLYTSIPLAPHSGVPLFNVGNGLLDGVPVSWSMAGALQDHGSLDPATTPTPTDHGGTSRVEYVPRQEDGDQSGPIEADAGVVKATVPLYELVTRMFDLTLFPISPLMGERTTQAPLAVEWHAPPGWSHHSAGGGATVDGTKCGGLGGEWILDGTYTRDAGLGVQRGIERWVVTIDEATLRGTYTYTDDATMETAVTVYVTGKAEGDAWLELIDDQVHMSLQDTKHTFTSTTDKGGSGHDTPVALQKNIVIWEPGARCGP
jgi:hypothetical protein